MGIGGIIRYEALVNNELRGSRINNDHRDLKRIVPEIEIKDVEVIDEITFQTINEYDSGLPQGYMQVKQEGNNGSRSRNYRVYSLQGQEIKRQLVAEAYVTQPIAKIVVVGTGVTASLYVQPSPSSQGGVDPVPPVTNDDLRNLPCAEYESLGVGAPSRCR